MKHKTMKNIWALVAVIGVVAMVLFTILPALQ
jgi:hypothetical protein